MRLSRITLAALSLAGATLSKILANCGRNRSAGRFNRYTTTTVRPEHSYTS